LIDEKPFLSNKNFAVSPKITKPAKNAFAGFVKNSKSNGFHFDFNFHSLN